MTRFSVPVIAAACIIAASLIASALILTHRPVVSVTAGKPAVVPAGRSVGTPLVSQASVKEQFRAQTLAAPALHHYRYNGKTYVLADVKVKQVLYIAKDDIFTLSYDCVWQPAMPRGGPRGGYCTLTNDGYGHYVGTAATVNPSGSDIPSGDIEVE